MSHSLQLSPLPSVRKQDDSQALFLETVGFVDEEAVAAMVSRPFQTRSVPVPEDLVLSLDDMDFAGWHHTSKTPSKRSPEVPPEVISAIVRRSAPPVESLETEPVEEPAITRWWLAGLAGALTTLLVSVILVGVLPSPRRTLENFFTDAKAVLAPAETLGSPRSYGGINP